MYFSVLSVLDIIGLTAGLAVLLALVMEASLTNVDIWDRSVVGVGIVIVEVEYAEEEAVEVEDVETGSEGDGAIYK